MTDNVVPGTLLLIIHLETGSLVPPCTHMAGPRSPVLLRHLDKVVGFLVPRTKVSFLVPDYRSSFRIIVPRSGFSFLVPVLTYRFITPSPPSEKDALLTLGIIYTIILLNVGPGNAGPKTCNSLTITSIGGWHGNPRKSLPCAGDRLWSAWYRRSSCRVCLFVLVTPRKFLKVRWDVSPNPHHYTRGTRLRVCPAVLDPAVFRSTCTWIPT